mgnify:CR=1 FL=1
MLMNFESLIIHLNFQRQLVCPAVSSCLALDRIRTKPFACKARCSVRLCVDECFVFRKCSRSIDKVLAGTHPDHRYIPDAIFENNGCRIICRILSKQAFIYLLTCTF